MFVAFLLTLTLGVITPGVRGQDQGCGIPLGLMDGTITTEQLNASSTYSKVELSYVRLNGSTDQTTGGWCPQDAQPGDRWLDVRLRRPYNVTGLLLQVPATQTGVPPPTLDSFFVFLELASSPPGVLTPYLAENGTIKEFRANYTGGVYKLALTAPSTVRRVRIQVGNFTTRPCFRMELLGCNGSDTAVPLGISSPSLSLNYQSLDDMNLVCQINNNRSFGVQYQVTWYRNDINVSFAYVKFENHTSKSSLPVNKTSFGAQQKYRCTIEACYQPLCKTVLGAAVTSNVFRPEILLLSKDFQQLSEGGNATYIEYQSTAPPSLLCVAGDQPVDCTVNVVVTANDQPAFTCPGYRSRLPQVFFTNNSNDNQSRQYSARLTNENWRTKGVILVAANEDGWKDGTTNSTLTLSVTLGNQLVPYTVADKALVVQVTDQDLRGYCSSLNGIFLRTFDGLSFSIADSGEFVLYRHDILPLEVRAFYKQCDNSALLCNCGAAVRSNDDVVLVEGCRGSAELARVHVFSTDNDLQNLVVRSYDAGLKYEVTLPTGGRLVVRHSRMGHLNLFFYPSPLDIGQTLGLCGHFDGNNTNEGFVAGQESVNWKVNTSDSWYNGLCPADAASQRKTTAQDFASTLSCPLLEGYESATVIGRQVLLQLSSLPLNCLRGIEVVNPFSVGNSSKSLAAGLWQNGTNETYARQFCEGVLNSSTAASACSNVTAYSFPAALALNICIESVRVRFSSL